MMLASSPARTCKLYPGDLPQITVPILFIHGGLSHPMFPAVARALARGRAARELRQLTGFGHVTYGERPDQFAQAICP
jgi:3-oxoadipate enol-lactonase